MEKSIYSNNFVDEFDKNRTHTASYNNKSANLNLRRLANNSMADSNFRPVNTPSIGNMNSIMYRRVRNKSSASRMNNSENANLSHQGFLK